jgi:hypothetical protein
VPLGQLVEPRECPACHRTGATVVERDSQIGRDFGGGDREREPVEIVRILVE